MDNLDYAKQYVMVGGIICQTNLVEIKIEKILAQNKIRFRHKDGLSHKISLFIKLCKQHKIISDTEEESMQEWRRYRNKAAHCIIGYDRTTKTPLILHNGKILITKEIFEDFSKITDFIISIISKLELDANNIR